jgi:uncharacterized membrane protein (TIGR02234 family)
MTDGTVAAAGAAGPRRELAVAITGCVLGAALVLVASGRAWVHFSVVQPPLPAVHGVATGHRVAGALTSLGLVVLAAAVALIATRQLSRQLAGVLVIAVGALTLVLGLRVVTDPRGSIAGVVTTATGRVGAHASNVSVSAWPWVAFVGGLVAALVGVLTVLRGRRWPAMGRRYDAATATAPASSRPVPRDETSMWDALDRGDDPTA